ncbi:MAG: hypothetical protein LH679_04760 [Cyanobacteria bacterium CAN_BIN43]|nr:hypothetical protein [Cyanobacteria bacterium CAN_BIN43]
MTTKSAFAKMGHSHHSCLMGAFFAGNRLTTPLSLTRHRVEGRSLHLAISPLIPAETLGFCPTQNRLY